MFRFKQKILVAIFLCFSLGNSNWVFSQSLTWPGSFGGANGEAWDVSSDGSVVVGWSENPGFFARAFRWTASGGMQDLGALGLGHASYSTNVSADGSIVVGWAENAPGYYRAFRWTASGGMQNLGTLGGNYSVAFGVSADGTTVVGQTSTLLSYVRAYRWSESTGLMQDLGHLGGMNSQANAVSADGSVVVGGSNTPLVVAHAFRWTASEEMQDLGTLGGCCSEAIGVSPDGSVVVGWSGDGNIQARAFRWTANEGMVDLGTLGGFNSQARDATTDGSVIVGWADSSIFYYAVRWTNNSGGIEIENLNVTYNSLLSPGSSMWVAAAITPDGRYIVGEGFNGVTGFTEPFLLDTGSPAAIEEPRANMTTFILKQNYPNPFNPVTNVQYRIPQAEWITLKIYDLFGREIKTLVNKRQAVGNYTVQWNGADNNNRPVASGMYWYVLRAGSFVQTKKMMLLK